MSGWVKLHRQILDSSLWQNPNAFLVFTYLLLRAAHVPKKFPFNGKDLDLQAGELISSHDSIRIGMAGALSIKQIRTALNYLKETDRVAIKTTTKFSVISITNWDFYQTEGRQEGEPGANEGQAKGKPRATNKNDKELKNEKNEKNKNPLTPFEGVPVWPSQIDTPTARAEWNRWLTYKHAKRSVYKTLDSHEAALRRCAKQFQTPERMIAAIEFSISQGWSGIFEEKKNQGGKKPNELSGVVGPNGYEYSEAFLYNMERVKKLREEEDEKSRT